MNVPLINKNLLGINGLGRIGKLTLWYHLNVGHFDGFVLNAGRNVGRKIDDIIQYLTCDSTYGTLDHFLFGYSGNVCKISIINESQGLIEINGISIKILTQHRNPKNINWAKEGVYLVVDCTGNFLDPSLPSDYNKGSLRGHLEAGAEKVIISAPFKGSYQKMPEDSGLFVYGINHMNYDPARHHLISAASCTTTGLAHMIKPLLETKETSNILTASMSTVHSATNNQTVLDTVPRDGTKDLRRNRSVFNNIIPTTTGAAIALEEILPEIKKVGFMADSVRIPSTTVSMITLNITFCTDLNETGDPIINREFINDLYKQAASGAQQGLLMFSERQNVSSDLMGYQSAIIIEGHETHTRTSFLSLNSETLKGSKDINLPVTHAKILGWYDNEYGCYVNSLGKLTVYVDKNMI
jgi:glyceraldehyde 3-phosphate dehydrogenase